jgi:hypothetical protein
MEYGWQAFPKNLLSSYKEMLNDQYVNGPKSGRDVESAITHLNGAKVSGYVYTSDYLPMKISGITILCTPLVVEGNVAPLRKWHVESACVNGSFSGYIKFNPTRQELHYFFFLFFYDNEPFKIFES